MIPASTPEHSPEGMLKINPDPLLTKEETADYLSLKVTHIEDLVKEGRITRHKFGRPYRIRVSECERLIREGTVPATRPVNASRFD